MDQNTAVVSMGASVAQVEIARSLETTVDSNSHVTFSRVQANTEPNVLTSEDQAQGEVHAVEAGTYVTATELRSGPFSGPGLQKSIEQLENQLETHRKTSGAVPKPTLRQYCAARGLDYDQLMQELLEEVAQPAVESSTYVVGVGLTSGGIQPQGCSPPRKDDQEVKRENSGGNVSYYSVEVKHPKRPERAPYIFEVEDLIQALNMNFGEGTVLKSLVRSCVEREFGIGKQGTDYIRDAEKMVHSSQEVLRARRIEKEKK